jgi:hypothetical protein
VPNPARIWICCISAVWKLRCSVRLVELEQHVLDAVRLGATGRMMPSSMIPQFYFDYLRKVAYHPARVVRHNAMDCAAGRTLWKLNSR